VVEFGDFIAAIWFNAVVENALLDREQLGGDEIDAFGEGSAEGGEQQQHREQQGRQRGFGGQGGVGKGEQIPIADFRLAQDDKTQGPAVRMFDRSFRDGPGGALVLVNDAMSEGGAALPGQHENLAQVVRGGFTGGSGHRYRVGCQRPVSHHIKGRGGFAGGDAGHFHEQSEAGEQRWRGDCPQVLRHEQLHGWRHAVARDERLLRKIRAVNAGPGPPERPR
jgi:hypothetical protein